MTAFVTYAVGDVGGMATSAWRAGSFVRGTTVIDLEDALAGGLIRFAPGRTSRYRTPSA